MFDLFWEKVTQRATNLGITDPIVGNEQEGMMMATQKVIFTAHQRHILGKATMR